MNMPNIIEQKTAVAFHIERALQNETSEIPPNPPLVKGRKSNIPEGWVMNGLGHLVPVESINPVALAEDEFVREVHAKVQQISQLIEKTQKEITGDVEAFRQLAMERYGLDCCTPSGYADLRSFDGRLSVQLSIGKKLIFGIELDSVKALFESCRNRWTDGMNKHAKALIDHSFRKDSKGNINADRLWELTTINFEGEADPEWDQAIEALKAAARWVRTRPYIRFYRQEAGKKPELVKLNYTDF